MSEFRLLGWYRGLQSYAEWSRNSPNLLPNTYERCRELMRNNIDRFPFFEVQEKIGGKWETCDLFGNSDWGTIRDERER